MKKKLHCQLMIIFLFFFYFCLSTCCVDIKNQDTIKVLDDQQKKLPRKSFVLVHTLATLDICNSETKKCDTNTNEIYGSGTIVSRTKFGFHVLTAGHICIYRNPIIELFENVKIRSYEYQIRTIDGFSHNAIFIKTDKKNDLCMLFVSENSNYSPIEIEKETPKPGERIYNIAAPKAIFAKNFALKYDGYYAGIYQGKSWYSNFATVGSSGSMILNRNGKLIGIVTQTYLGIQSASVGPLHNTIKSFVQNNIK